MSDGLFEYVGRDDDGLMFSCVPPDEDNDAEEEEEDAEEGENAYE